MPKIVDIGTVTWSEASGNLYAPFIDLKAVSYCIRMVVLSTWFG